MWNGIQNAPREGPLPPQFASIQHILDPVVAETIYNRTRYWVTVLERPSENVECMHGLEEAQDNDEKLYKNDIEGEEQEQDAEGSDDDEMVDVDNEIETESESEPNKITAAKGYIIDPIFGNTRKGLLMDDLPDRSRRVWNTWCQISRNQRAKWRPLGYMAGDRHFEFEEWLLLKAERRAVRAQRAHVGARGVMAAVRHQRLAKKGRREVKRIAVRQAAEKGREA